LLTDKQSSQPGENIFLTSLAEIITS